MTTTPIGDTTLECVLRGKGTPVVLVHGSASDHRTWRAHVDELAGRHRVICCSRRYHWPNDPARGDETYSMARQRQDLEELVRRTADGPAHLVGHSYGALLCLHLAVAQPGLVRSLVLVEPPALRLLAGVPPTPAELGRLLLRRPGAALALARFGALGMLPARRAAERGDLERAVRRFGRAVLGRRALRSLSPARWRQVLDNTIRAEYLTGDFLPLPAADLARVRVPVLIVTGRRSPRLFHHLADRLEELLPACRRVDLPGASHMVHEDNPRGFTAQLGRFLDAVERGD